MHVEATPASAARDFFRKKSFASCALLWCSLPCLALGLVAPNLFAICRLVPVLLEGLTAVFGRPGNRLRRGVLVLRGLLEALWKHAMAPAWSDGPRRGPFFRNGGGVSRPKARRRVLIIGIAGCSGCGKSTLAKNLAKHFASPIIPVSLDLYFRPKWMPKAA